ncbi:MAG TPA: SDR family oxidoreductase [Candidatus Nanoarchaeia archaeon]|nr:SDR family oxidoreductase [Candidatus Nanoarchaeia archaeon]
MAQGVYIATGGSGGLGQIVVSDLRAKGNLVLETARSSEKFVKPEFGKVFTGDLAERLGDFLESMTSFLDGRTAEYFGLFNAIGIPARVPENASDADVEQIMRQSLNVNYMIPLAVAQHFIQLLKGRKGSIVFVSSQHTLKRTPGKETYFVPKLRLEEAAVELSRLNPNVSVNVILPGNLGIGMSEAKRADYERDGTLVDTSVVTDACFKYLTAPEGTGQKIWIYAEGGRTRTMVFTQMPALH